MKSIEAPAFGRGLLRQVGALAFGGALFALWPMLFPPSAAEVEAARVEEEKRVEAAAERVVVVKVERVWGVESRELRVESLSERGAVDSRAVDGRAVDSRAVDSRQSTVDSSLDRVAAVVASAAVTPKFVALPERGTKSAVDAKKSVAEAKKSAATAEKSAAGSQAQDRRALALAELEDSDAFVRDALDAHDSAVTSAREVFEREQARSEQFARDVEAAGVAKSAAAKPSRTNTAEVADVAGVPLRVLIPSSPAELERYLRRSNSCLLVSRLTGDRADVVESIDLVGGRARPSTRPPCSGVPRVIRDNALIAALGDPLSQSRRTHPAAAIGELVMQIVLPPALLAEAESAAQKRLGAAAPKELARRAAAAGYEIRCFAKSDGTLSCL